MAIALTAGEAIAAPPALTGRVVDAAGEPVEGAVVYREGSPAETTTGPGGRFSLGGLPDGPAVIVALKDGATATARVTLPAPPLTLALQPVEDYVTEVRAPTPHADTASTTRIDARTIQLMPHRTAEDALRSVPGLVLVQHGSEGKGHQFLLRGFDAIHGADLEVRLEGILLNEPSNIHAQGYLDLGFIIPELIDAVRVTKGPFTLTQGFFALAGTAEYRLGVSEEDRGARVAYEIGTTHRHRVLLSWTPKGGNGRSFVAAEGTWDAGFGERRWTRRATLLSRLDLVDTPATGRLTLLGAAYGAWFALPGTTRVEAIEAGDLGFYDAHHQDGEGFSGRALLALTHAVERGAHRVTTRLHGAVRRLALLENFTGYLADPERGDARDQEQLSTVAGADVEYAGGLGDAFALLGEAGFRSEHLDQQQRQWAADGTALPVERRLDGWQHMIHVAAGVRWSPSYQLRWDLGVRGDVIHVGVRDGLTGEHGRATRWAISPRTVLQWFVLPELSVIAAYGRGARPPEARAFTSFDPAAQGFSEEVPEGLEPGVTVSDAVELGLRWAPGPWLQLALSGFATFIERESIFDHVSGISLELNGTRRLGLELTATSSPLDWLTVSGHLTWVDARFAESGADVPLVPWLSGGLTLTVDHPLGIHGGLRLLGLAPRPLPHGATGEGYAQLDLTAGYRWRWLSVFLVLENVLARELREGEFHYASHWRPGEPRSFIPVTHITAGPPLNARLTLQAVW